MAIAKILLVEDDKVQAGITKKYLESSGYEVVCVDNGTSAIKTARTEPIDIILLDKVLPDMDGNNVCRWLKLNGPTKSIPIIFLTVKGSTEEKVTGLEAGADDYLPKPYSESELNARIYASLRTKSLQDELRQMNYQLRDLLTRVEVLAITDSLTELFNRRHFENIMEKEFIRTLRYNTPASCLMIDVDHFKRINDTYGHRIGDSVLREIAKIIRESIRNIDTAARWGGEEFVVMFPQTNEGNALVLVKRILNSVSGHKFSSCSEQITISIGMANIPHPSIDTVDKLMNAVDLALYEAKAKGRNRVEVVQ